MESQKNPRNPNRVRCEKEREREAEDDVMKKISRV